MKNFLRRFARHAFVIAEVGGNHNGDLKTALELIAAAARSGADAVKFQTYRAEALVHPDEEPLPLARSFYRTQLERYRSLEFTPQQYHRLVDAARKHKILFLSSPFDKESVDLLDALVPFYKIASGSLTDLPLIRYVVSKRKPVILSTGMSTVSDIKRAIACIPKQKLVLLHCVSNYPTPSDELSLRSIGFLSGQFGVPVGFSDHSIGMLAAVCAVALGAVAVEKHITLDKKQAIGDHVFSLEPDEFKQMIVSIRTVETMLGNPGKRIVPSEVFFRKKMHKGIYAAHSLAAGSRIKKDDLVCLRPNRGICVSEMDSIVGRTLRTAVRKLDPIQPSAFRGAT